MLHHASRLANSPSLPLSSILQVAAGRAWTRSTSMVVRKRVYHRTTSPSQEFVARTVRERGESSSMAALATGDNEQTLREPHRRDFPVRKQDSHRDHSAVLEENTAYSMALHIPHVQCPDPENTSSAGVSREPSMGSTATANTCQVSYLSRRITPASVPLDDTFYVDPARVTLSPYEDDPPWSELLNSLTDSTASLPTVNVGGRFRPLIHTVPEPRTSTALHQNLLRLLSAEYPPSLQQLIAYHSEHLQLQSTKSYNLLIAISIRQASFGNTRRLLRKMERLYIPEDLETRKLRVRLLVRSGCWEHAWKVEHFAALRDARMPLSIWLEFFGSEKRGAFQAREAEVQDPASVAPWDHTVPVVESDISTQTARIRMLMKNMPSLTPSEWTRTPPYVIRTIVDSLVRAKERQAALDITKHYFQRLPADLDTRWRDQCLKIIHLHMTPGWKRNLGDHIHIRRTLYTLLDMHPSFRPNSNTLFLLLQTLRKTKKCGTWAQHLVEKFQTRWGRSMVDQRVRRRVASLAVKEGRVDIAELARAEEERVDFSRKLWRVEREIQGGRRGRKHQRLLRQPDKVVFCRRSAEGWKWRLLRRRVWRLTARKSAAKCSV